MVNASLSFVLAARSGALLSALEHLYRRVVRRAYLSLVTYLLQRRFGSLLVMSDSSIVSGRFPGERTGGNVAPVKSQSI